MQWSKLRSNIRSFIYPQLKDRIDIHCTRYHDAHDDYGEVWITVDKIKIQGGGYYHWYKALSDMVSPDKLNISHGFHKDFYSPQIETKEVEEIMNKGIHSTNHIIWSLENYLNTPLEESLVSNNPIFKAFALVDRRLGQRRFDKIKLVEDENELVKIFYKLRKDSFVK